MRNIYLSMLWIAFLLSLSACEEDSEGPVNNPPLANAGQGFEIAQGQEASLDGSSSSDPDGDNLTYAWVLKSKPDGSQSTLTDANSATAEFTPDIAGEYLAELTVSDGEGGTSKAEVKITVTATQAPADGCRLVAFGFEKRGNMFFTRVEYNDEGYAVSAKVDGFDYPTTYEYDSENLVVRINFKNNKGSSSYNTYTYADGLLIEEKFVNEEGAEGILTFKYDDQERIIERKSQYGPKITYAYDNKGNVIKEDFYGDDNGKTLSRTTTYENFDEKFNYFHAFRGLPASESPYISPNNYGTMTVTDHRNGSTSITTNYTYQYNKSGYPTEVRATSEDGSVRLETMEYEGCE